MESDSPRTSSSSTLQRGKACLNCRRRKMKCDGVRPVCGPCSRANRPDDCEYTDGQGRTRTQMLEDTISQLEARVQELENPDGTSPSVMLHDPRSVFLQTQQSPPPGPSLRSSPLFSPMTEFSHGSHSSSASSPSVAGTGASLQSSTPRLWVTSDEPPVHVAQELLDAFLQHASDLGFFLHVVRFRHSAFLPPGNANRPISALMNVIYLWGIHLTGKEELASREPLLVSRMAAQLGNAVPATPSHQILQVIQAKLLLANYFLQIGHFLAGRHQSDSAASLAIACGLHKIRSAQPMPAFTSFVDPIDLGLQEPRDQVEEGERINAFWAVFCMDRCSAVTFGGPSVISDTDASGMQIDTPWPLEMETYERGQIYPNLRTSGTLRSFFTGLNNGWPWENHGPLTQLSKAAALFERATRLAATWRPEIPNVGSFYSDFVAIDQRIDEFKSQLPPLDQVSSRSAPLVHLAYCLGNGATMQLHATFSSQNTGSRAKCLAAVMVMIRANQAVRAHEFKYTAPVLGTLWAAGGRVIINEIIALRSFQVEPTPSPHRRDTELRNALEQLQSVMAASAPRCALMNYQLGRLQQESAGV
ncbi:hypothetical protein BC834DRAFT_871888 [Gloeopeniophorella convolvens]|nr:hypothetical protein BC834DRAFT_871888 [Gloeopeniophorella convolvens]